VSVDTYLKKKNLSRYNRVQHGDIEILVTPVLAQWATRVEIEANRFLLWKRFEVWADHRHRPT
jgi:hypothetical protein